MLTLNKEWKHQMNINFHFYISYRKIILLIDGGEILKMMWKSYILAKVLLEVSY